MKIETSFQDTDRYPYHGKETGKADPKKKSYQKFSKKTEEAINR
jgi:hypothetical protein